MAKKIIGQARKEPWYIWQENPSEPFISEDDIEDFEAFDESERFAIACLEDEAVVKEKRLRPLCSKFRTGETTNTSIDLEGGIPVSDHPPLYNIESPSQRPRNPPHKEKFVGKVVSQSRKTSTGTSRIKSGNPCQDVPTENNRKILRLLVNPTEQIACPDSGSEENIMSEALAMEQKLRIRRQPKDLRQFELANGEFVWSTGRVQANVQLPGLYLRRRKFWFHIFKLCPVPLVLGVRFLAEAKILTSNRHLLEECPPELYNVPSPLWIGSPRGDFSAPKQPRNRLECWLDDHYLGGVADTGSDLNLISPKCAEREEFPIDNRLEARNLVQLGDGTQAETVGQVYIYSLTLDWRNPEAHAIRASSSEDPPEVEQPDEDDQAVLDNSASGVIFHVLPGLPCDVILGQDLLEKTNAFTLHPNFFSSKSRDKTKPFEYKVLISLGPISKILHRLRNKEQNPAVPDDKEIHDDERHAEMFRCSEMEAEITAQPAGQRAQLEAREKERVRAWNARHVNCAFCNPV